MFQGSALCVEAKVKSESVSCSVMSWFFATLWTEARQAPLSMGFSRQEYWRGLRFPSPGDLPDPDIESRSRALQENSLSPEPLGKVWTLEAHDFTFVCFPGLNRHRNLNVPLQKRRGSPMTTYCVTAFCPQRNQLDLASITPEVETRRLIYISLLVNFKTSQKGTEVEEKTY